MTLSTTTRYDPISNDRQVQLTQRSCISLVSSQVCDSPDPNTIVFTHRRIIIWSKERFLVRRPMKALFSRSEVAMAETSYSLFPNSQKPLTLLHFEHLREVQWSSEGCAVTSHINVYAARSQRRQHRRKSVATENMEAKKGNCGKDKSCSQMSQGKTGAFD